MSPISNHILTAVYLQDIAVNMPVNNCKATRRKYFNRCTWSLQKSAIHSMSSHSVPCRHEFRRDDMERDDMDNIAHAHR